MRVVGIRSKAAEELSIGEHTSLATISIRGDSMRGRLNVELVFNNEAVEAGRRSRREAVVWFERGAYGIRWSLRQQPWTQEKEDECGCLEENSGCAETALGKGKSAK